MYERQRSSAFIQLTPRHESRISDGLSTHQVDVHRSDVRDEEVSDGGRRDARNDIVEYAGPGQTLHVALKRGANNDNDVEQFDIVEFADPQTLQNTFHPRPMKAKPWPIRIISASSFV